MAKQSRKRKLRLKNGNLWTWMVAQNLHSSQTSGFTFIHDGPRIGLARQHPSGPHRPVRRKSSEFGMIAWRSTTHGSNALASFQGPHMDLYLLYNCSTPDRSRFHPIASHLGTRRNSRNEKKKDLPESLIATGRLELYRVVNPSGHSHQRGLRKYKMPCNARNPKSSPGH